ncbi:hypothetical protein SDC9_144316 [bioreactor metagenome]|uniref:Uncharacterized protein n=1 Tax=bioreactor metagenome TaxID=1076179 RepID=A0A645E8L7_9ZZZZ
MNFLTLKYITIAKPAPNKIPGIIPAINNAFTDTLLKTLKYTNVTLGGIIGPRIPDEAIKAPLNSSGYLSLVISGIRTAHSIDATAFAEPNIAASIIAIITAAYASPPRTCPIKERINSNNFDVTPEAFITSPATMKNGIHVRPTTSIPVKILCVITFKNAGLPISKIWTTPAIPKTAAIGTPANNVIINNVPAIAISCTPLSCIYLKLPYSDLFQILSLDLILMELLKME